MKNIKIDGQSSKTSRHLPARLVPPALAVVAIAMTLGGCVVTPHTTIRGNLNRGTFLVKAPKDGDLKGLDISRDTNGAVRVHVDEHIVKMNPDVIAQTAAGQAAIVKAATEGAAAVAAAAAQGALAGAKAAGTAP